MSVSATANNSTPPAGSVITVVDTADGKELAWCPSSRHPLQWLVASIGTMCLLTTLVVIGVFLSGGFSTPKGMPDGIDPFDDFGPLLMLPHLLIGLYLLWGGLRRGRPQRVVLDRTTFRYDTGSPTLPVPLGWFFCPMLMHGSSWFGGGGSDNSLCMSRKRYEIPTAQLAEFKLDRVGERQRLTVDYGADRIEIGAGLREPEREWLAGTLQAFQQELSDS